MSGSSHHLGQNLSSRATKRSLYTPASPLSMSRQLQSTSWQQEPSATSDSDSPASSPRRGAPRPSPTPAIPLHSPSLSTINSSPPDSSIGGRHHHVRSPELRTSGNPVLVVSADRRREQEPPAVVQVTTSEVPSPVKVVRHFSPPSERRFSSNFTDYVPPPPSSRPLPPQSSPRLLLETAENRFSSNLTDFVPPPPVSMETSSPPAADTAGQLVSNSESTSQSLGLAQSLSLSQHVQSPKGQVAGSSSHSKGKSSTLLHGGERRLRVASSDDSVLATNRAATGKMVTSQSADLTTIVEENMSTRPQPKKAAKKGGRVIPSRYMAAARKPQAPSHGQYFNSAANKSSAAAAVKPKRTRKPKMADSFSVSTFNTPGLRPSAAATSTPAVAGAPMGLHFDNVSLIQDPPPAAAAAAANKAATKGSKTKRKQQPPVPPPSSSCGIPHSTLLQHRLFQAAYLDVMTAKALKNQEEQAQVQLTALWEAVEKQKRREAELMRAVEHEKRMLELERSVDYQLQGLEPVCEQLTETQPQYTNMAAALDTTRHELPMTGISPLNESELLQQFKGLEAQFGDLMSDIREKVTEVSSVASSSQCLLKTAEQEHQELQSASEEMEDMTKSVVHETSLFFEQKQLNQALRERNN